ncbi:MAG: tetratricopeptide repeat protein [Candidatus Riflebacteria bacterium]|nr:tetratricopeptide repeat protein [Candidatus Riflebacteria bacterium]
MELAFPALAIRLDAWLHEPGPPAGRPSLPEIRRLLDAEQEALAARWLETAPGWPTATRTGFGLACLVTGHPLAGAVPFGRILDTLPPDRLSEVASTLEGFDTSFVAQALTLALTHPGPGAEAAAWLLAEASYSIPLADLPALLRARLWSPVGRRNLLCLVPMVIRGEAGNLLRDLLPTLAGEQEAQVQALLDLLRDPPTIQPTPPGTPPAPAATPILTPVSAPPPADVEAAAYGGPPNPPGDGEPALPLPGDTIGPVTVPVRGSSTPAALRPSPAPLPDQPTPVRPSVLPAHKPPPRTSRPAAPGTSGPVTRAERLTGWFTNLYVLAGGALALVLAAFLTVARWEARPAGAPDSRPKAGEKVWIDAVTRRPITESFLAADKEYRMGEIFRIQDRFADATSFYRAATALDPTHVEAQDRLGYCLYKMKDFPAAEEQFKAALRIDAGFYRSHFYLGRLHRRAQRWEEALAEFRLAFAGKKDLAQIGIEYLDLLIRLGLFEEARPVAGELVTRFPSNRQIADLQARVLQEGS